MYVPSHSKNSDNARKTSSNASGEVEKAEAKTIDLSADQSSASLSNYSEGVGEHKIQVNQRKV